MNIWASSVEPIPQTGSSPARARTLLEDSEGPLPSVSFSLGRAGTSVADVVK